MAALFDPFNYTGALTSNGWTAYSTAGLNQLTVLDTASDSGNSLSYAGLVASTGNRLEILNTGEDVFKAITITGSVVYYSCLLKVTVARAGDYCMALAATATPPVSTFYGRLFIKTGVGASTFQLGLLNIGIAGQTYYATDLALNTTYFVVVKIDGSASPVVASLFVNPVPGASEPSATFSNSVGGAALGSVASLVIRQGGSSLGPTLEVDELRVGETWANVAPGGSATVPGAPTGVSAVGGNTLAIVSFTAPASNGGSVITSYTATSSPGGFTATGSGSSLTVYGLTNGTAYTFTVVATNFVGNSAASDPSNSVSASTSSIPDAPTSVSATRGNAQATVSFTAPAVSGGSAITSYTATSSPGGFTASGSGSPLTVSGLTNGTAYTFTVIATNSFGNSTASAASSSVIPATVPDVPTSVSATVGSTQAFISFTAPASNGGAAITSYTATSSPGGFTATGPASALTVSGLTNGTSYTFTVVATNSVGNSSASDASNSVTPDEIALALFDPFNYTGALTSNGWTANASAGANPLTVLDTASDSGNSLSYAGLPASTGNRLLVNNTGEDVNKAITIAGNICYYSCLLKVTAAQLSGDYCMAIGATSGASISSFN